MPSSNTKVFGLLGKKYVGFGSNSKIQQMPQLQPMITKTEE
jgi:hypothetical protein